MSYITIRVTKSGSDAGEYEIYLSHEDKDLVSFKWQISKPSHRVSGRYVHRRYKGKMVRIHRVILERMIQRPLIQGEMVDHINMNPLDNRRENLRLATHSQNNMNKKLQANNKSGYRGVSFHKASGKWQARISVDEKMIHLGVHETPEKAYEVYCEASKLYHGEYARLERKNE